MGQLALAIHDEAAARIPAAPVTDPADLLTGPQLLGVFAQVEAAVAALELLSRGARIVRVAGVPDNAADGEDGDLGLNSLTTDLYAKDAGAWEFLFRLKGDKGDTGQGAAGLSAYQLAQQQGFSGSLDQWLASLGRAGAAGQSAYQVAVAAGFVGNTAAWLASLKGAPGDPGAAGGSVFHESFAPDAGYVGKAGDTYYYHSSASTYAIYDHLALGDAGGNPWRQRFTTPEQTTGAGGVGVTAQAVADVLRATASVSFAVVGGKLELTAVGVGSGGGGAALPSQTGQAGKFLQTDGSATSWQMVPAGYTDNQAKAAAGSMAMQSTTIAPVFNLAALTLQYGVRPASLDASHFSPLFVSDGVFSAANKTKLETAGNWSGVNWNGIGSQELTGSRKFDTHVDNTYFYINIAPDNPIRLARA